MIAAHCAPRRFVNHAQILFDCVCQLISRVDQFLQILQIRGFDTLKCNIRVFDTLNCHTRVFDIILS